MGFPAYFFGDDENGPAGAFWLNTLAQGSPAQALRLGMQYKSQQGLARRLRRGLGLAVLWVLASFDARRFPKGERKALWCVRRRIPLAPGGD